MPKDLEKNLMRWIKSSVLNFKRLPGFLSQNSRRETVNKRKNGPLIETSARFNTPHFSSLQNPRNCCKATMRPLLLATSGRLETVNKRKNGPGEI